MQCSDVELNACVRLEPRTARWQDQRVSVLLPTVLQAAPHRAVSHARVELVCLELVHLVGTHVNLLCNHPVTARVCTCHRFTIAEHE
jgi:hypothetical protein